MWDFLALAFFISLPIAIAGAIVFTRKRRAGIRHALEEIHFKPDMFYYFEAGFIALELNRQRIALGRSGALVHVYDFGQIKKVETCERGNRTELKVLVADVSSPSHTISFRSAREARRYADTLFAAVD